MVDTWALKGLPYYDFGAYVYTIKLHGAFGFGPQGKKIRPTLSVLEP